MTRQRAKEILLLYRPGIADEDDPEIPAALEAAKEDPELARWLEDHGAVQKAVRARFQQILVPEGLKEQILSERKAHLTPGSRRKAMLIGAAAAALGLLVVLGGLYWRPHRDKNLAEFRGRMAGIVLREYPKMDLETNDLSEIRRFLAREQAHGDYTLPQSLEKVSATGCAILNWRGHRVSMICFNSGTKRDPNEPSDLFLFIVDRSAVPQAPARGRPRFAQVNKVATVSWSSGNKTYVLGAFGDEAFIRKYL